MLTELLTQFDGPMLGQDLDAWGDVLVIVVMAILWLIGGLAKVISSRKGAGRQPEGAEKQPRPHRASWQERLARKAEEMQRAAEARVQEQAGTRARTQKPRPTPGGRITVRTGQRGDSVMVYERPESQTAAERERQARQAVRVAGQQATASVSIEPRIEIASPISEPVGTSMTAAMREPPQPLEPVIAHPETTGTSAGGFHPASLIDYSDPDALRKAILHYEILGKPLALREPSEETSSF